MKVILNLNYFYSIVIEILYVIFKINFIYVCIGCLMFEVFLIFGLFFFLDMCFNKMVIFNCFFVRVGE